MMIGKGPLTTFTTAILLAIVVLGSAAVTTAQTCEDIMHCTKCLKETETCAWYTGNNENETPGCKAQTECTDPDKCLVGKENDNFGNGYKCGTNICSLQSDATCNDCLNVDLTGRRQKKSDCAWFRKGSQAPRCIYRKQCDDRGFEGGKCTLGKKRTDNTNKCNRRSRHRTRDRCPRLRNCARCLTGRKGQMCAWTSDDAGNYSCVAEDKCEGDNCTYGSLTFNIRKQCKRLAKPKPDASEGEVGIEKCEDFTGLCTDCLNNGCGWVNDIQSCVPSCDMIADIGCEELSKPEILNRSLLFDSGANKICYDGKLRLKNIALCREANAKGGCKECVKTELLTAPDEVNLDPPTCHYFPFADMCLPDQATWIENGQDTCYDPPVFTEFPELLRQTVAFAINYLNTKYPEAKLNIQVLGPNDFYTEEVDPTRVRLFVEDKADEDSPIVKIPKVQ